MDTTITHQSKPTWRFERPHRVRLFTHRRNVNEVWANDELYFEAAKKFSETDKYRWVESNQVKLDFDFDSNTIDWFKQVRFYADLDEAQYVDYCLRFFNHHDEEWK